MLTTLVALSILAPQAAEQAPGGFTFAGRQVPVRFPSPTPTEAPAGFLDWDGWNYRKGALSLADGPFPVSGDWRPLAQSAPKDDAQPWRIKVVFFTGTDILDRYDNGLIRQRRGYLTDEDLNEALQAVARYRAVLAAQSDGALRFEPDVAVDTELLRDEVAKTTAAPFALPSILNWVRANVNGGTYQSEDGVYRGPYHGVVAFVPGPFPGMKHVDTVNGTPVDVHYLQARTVQPNEVEEALSQAVLQQAASRFGGLYGTRGGGEISLAPTTVADLGEPSPEALAAHGDAKAVFRHAKPWPGPAAQTGWRAPTTDLAIVQDAERGNILHYKEIGPQRTGGFQLPSPESGFPSGTLSFFVRTKSGAPIAVQAVGSDGKTVSYSLGRDPLSPPNVDAAPARSISFVADGTWQKISLDLRPVSPVRAIRIGPSPNALYAERQEIGTVEADFDDFAISDEPASSPADAPDGELADALKAVEAMKAGAPSPDLAKLLLSPSNLVVLNTLNAYTVVKDPSVLPKDLPRDPKVDPKTVPAVPNLKASVVSLSPRRQEIGLRAIAHQDTDEGWSFLRRQVVVGATDIAKGIAAELLAAKAVPNLTENLLTLVASPGRFSKLKAIEGISTIKTNAGSVMLGTFLYHEDPLVKLKVTDVMRPDDDALLRKAMWSAVNEPWDAVRLESLKKLILAKDAEFKTEGYKGVRDDSVWVRLALVEWLGQEHPAAESVPALKLALTDSSFRVRAAALTALKATPGSLAAEDVQSLKNDPYPAVRAAYAELARAKGLP
ncbi:MAG TPA: HEAT repeat domain-containing protein [Fimbriimonas sp.]